MVKKAKLQERRWISSTKWCIEEQILKEKLMRQLEETDERIYHIISDCSKLVQMELKTRWEGQSIRNCARHKNLTILPNGTYTNQNLSERTRGIYSSGILIQTDHPIPARRPGQELTNKNQRTCHLVNFVIPTDQSGKMKGNKNTNTWTLLEN